MNTVKVNQEVEYKAISLSDAIKMVELMDRLVDSINATNFNKIVKVLKDKGKKFNTKYSNVIVGIEADKEIYHILYELGFRSKLQLEEYNEQYVIDHFKEINK